MTPRDEESLASFLKTTERDMARPDRAFLEQLGKQSAQAFQASFTAQPPRRQRPVRRLLALAAAAAVAIAVGTYLLLPARPAAAATFSQVQEKLAGAPGLHLTVTRQGETSEVWARDGKLRRDRADGTYEIAKKDKLWLVDEKDNRATPRPCLYFHGDTSAEIDLLSLLGLTDGDARDRFARTQPADKLDKDGAQLLVYRTKVPSGKEEIEVEALVYAGTLRLHSARATPLRGAAKPVAEVTVVGYEEEVGEDRFVIKDTLTEDGRLGKVVDVQGLVSVRPVMCQRWTPISEGLIVRPGDWVRTDVRGANATKLRFVKGSTLVLGPGSLVEVLRPGRVRVHHGEIEASAVAGDALELLALGGQRVDVKGTLIYRVGENSIVQVKKEPGWLKGFKGTAPQETLGSLVAKVDGRNVSLSVGYHKVTVDVRDQIARTTIEESFVNHTNGVLEGVFHFPLPQDASISGFGMWIGDNLVEADVVEKQRAREIYETILNERRDPGLLEWTGGNIFKARVYPIPGQSEKRVKITYTQVLPLRDGRYRYSYALQSDMLREHPLRELNIDFKVHSAVPLRLVHSPTHTTRTEQTQHAAHLEFSAQEHTPTRDFEVVVEVASADKPEVVLIPHRRGDDGYFLLQVLPPSQGALERALVPDGAPLRLLILADTSASMDVGQRARQAELVAALTGSLTPKDSVNLACCDVDCDWAFESAQPATPQTVGTLRQFLGRRTSLGWTDLDRAFASAFRQCQPGTHVIYVGDGVVTTGDGDPVAFTKRLRRLYEDQGKRAVCHTVAVSSSFEPAVVQTIASLGGGSFRRVTSEQAPAAVAREWLDEASRPALRDLKVEFKGLRTARVYPEELPNLPAGAQQIVLGRYLPEGKDQEGEVIVTGRQGDKVVGYSAHVSLNDAEDGNSFIPRLWARMHLDRLLAQGSSQSVKDEIIALSEEYQIITPYTSLLVLESDADRARFGVKRTFHMRDGEKFFAKGRGDVNYELLQKQMKRAGTWRQGLRRAVLRQLATLGRNLQALQVQQALEIYSRTAGRLAKAPESQSESGLDGRAPAGARMGEVFFEDLGDREKKELLDDAVKTYEPTSGKDGEDRKSEFDEPPAGKETGESAPVPTEDDLTRSEEKPELRERDAKEGQGNRKDRLDDRREIGRFKDLPEGYGEESPPFPGLYAATEDLYRLGRPVYSRGERGRRGGWFPDLHSSLIALFPSLPVAPAKAAPTSAWTPEARDLVRGLLRADRLRRAGGGIEIVRQTETFDARRSRLTERSRRIELFTPDTWLTRSDDDRSATLVHWCDGHERGVMSLAFQLGRVRSATDEEGRTPPLELSDFSLAPLDESYGGCTVTIEKKDKDRVLLVLAYEASPKHQVRVLIDTTRRVLLSMEHFGNGKSTGATKFDDFIEVAGCWWARKVETLDEQGRRTSLATQTIRALPIEDVRQQMAKELASRDRVQLLQEPLPRLVQAKKAAQAGKGSFEERMVLLLHFAATQHWGRAREQLEAMEAGAQTKSGLRWLSDAFLHASRRHEELKARMLAEARALAKSPTASDTYALAEHLLNRAPTVLSADETLGLLDALRPVYAARPEHVLALLRWNQQRASYLQSLGRTDDALRLFKQLATDNPDDLTLQRQYAQALVSKGDYAAAYDSLKRALGAEDRWLPEEADTLRDQYASLLYQQGRYDDLANFLADWVKRNPTTTSPYAQYLGALVRIGQLEKVNDLMGRWLREGQVKGDVSPAVSARMHAAINQAMGRGHNLYTDRIDERWLAPLAEAVLFFARQPDSVSVAQNIMYSSFSRTDAAHGVRKTTTALLAAQVDTLAPAQLDAFVSWGLGDELAGDMDAWKTIIAGLHKRWLAETKPDVKDQIGQVIAQALTHRATPTRLLDFLREQLRDGPATSRPAHARTLFNALLRQQWSSETEVEAFSLLARLSSAEATATRLHAQVVALYELTDRMVEARYESLMAKVEHPEKLKRIELKTRQAEARKQARAGLANRLRQEIARQDKALGPWLTIERNYLDVILGRDPRPLTAECRALLGDKLPPGEEDEPVSENDALARLLESVLWHRCLATLGHLAAQKGAEPASTEALLSYVDRGIGQEGEASGYKALKFRLLVALDLPKDLEVQLRRWSEGKGPDGRWRVALAFLLAEQGRVAEAVAQLEAVEKADELSPAVYRALADWYMALGRRDQHERAMISAFKALDESSLSRRLYYRWQSWQRSDGHAPTELDRDVLLMFSALFEKATAPGNYVRQLQQFYQTTRDFRLLVVLADAVVGHTAGQVYAVLQGTQGLVNDIHEEAAVDELAAYIAKVRERAKTAVDRRALDLLEALVRRRAAELKNQPAPHVEAALAALKRAFRHDWSDGERPLMADLLAAMGTMPQAPLAAEQLRQLETLHQGTKAGTDDRLHIADRYAAALWGYGRRPQAIDVLESGLTELQDAQGGVLPVTANYALTALISYHESAGHHERAEKLIVEQLKHPAHRQQELWLTLQLYEVHLDVLRVGGEDSLGKGQPLYSALTKKLRDELGTSDANHRSAVLNLLCRTYRTAHANKVPGVRDDIKAFAFGQFATVIRRQTSNYESMVTEVAALVHDPVGPAEAVEFLLDRAAEEPAWFRLNNQDTWSRHGWYLAQWRAEAKLMPAPVEARLLHLVLTELRYELETRQSHNRGIYYQNYNSYYWKEKELDFVRVAEDMLTKHAHSGAAVQYIAEYLSRGVNRHARAIEALLAARKDKLLDQAGDEMLVRYLHEANRYAESIPILTPLVQKRPESLDYRVLLMRAYFHTDRKADLVGLLKDTDTYFHKDGRWNENTLSVLAGITLETQLFEQSVGYYKEVIALREGMITLGAAGDNLLSSFYQGLARAWSGLGKTSEAVDAACGAVVAWGRQQQYRAQALQALADVLRGAKDLDRYAAELDKKEAETGQASALVHKALARVYVERAQHQQALAQLRLAAELQPNDAEVRQLLVAEYDALGDQEGALRQLLESVQITRRDIKLYQDMGHRLEAQGKKGETERAYTSVLDVLPSEAEGHALLAEVRQGQNRWADAIAHWEQVVRIRSLDPPGLVKLATAQVHEHRWEDAAATVKKLRARDWPARFGNVEQQVRELEQHIANGRKAP